MKQLLFSSLIAVFACSASGFAQTGTQASGIPPALLKADFTGDSAAFPTDNSQPWNLQQCIAYAQVHNISIQQQQLNVRLSKVDLLQSQGNLLPNLNGYASHTYQYGRTVDRFTNTFANSMVLSDNFYLSSNVTVFSGMQNYNSIKQNQFDLQSSRFQLAQTENDIALSVANAYLQVLYSQEQLDLAQQQAAVTKSQVDRMQKLVDAGSSAKGTLLDMQSQLALDEVSTVNAQNGLTIAYLNLTQLMNLDTTLGFQIVKPDLAVPNENIMNTSPAQIFQAALASQPSIKKSQMDYQSADKGVAIAYGALSPSITLQGSIGTGYSGAAKDITGANYAGYDTTGITSGGDWVLSPNYTFTYATTPFGDQFNNNVNKSIGVQMNIPIFNRFQVSSNIERAKIQRENAQLNVDLSQQQLQKNIDQAWADARAAFLKYQANQKAVDAAQLSFRYTEDRFNLGGANSIDYNNAKNKLAQAQSNLIQARYDYIFRLKVLDYYQGKPITF